MDKRTREPKIWMYKTREGGNKVFSFLIKEQMLVTETDIEG